MAAARSVVRRLPKPIRRFLHRYLAHPPLWHLTLPGFDRWLELRWAMRVRRAPVMSPQEHAAAVADPGRRGADIEVPLACAICGGTRLRALLHVHDQKRATPRWDYHVVRCAACGFLYRHPGIRPERLGELYASGKYAKFLAGKYTRKRVRRYEVTMAPFGAAVRVGPRAATARFRVRQRPVPRHRLRARLRVLRRRSGGRRDRGRPEKPSGRHTYNGAPTEIPEIAAGGFDVITMWSVLAHLAQPVEDLTMLRRLLAPDGVLLILTVNAGSLVFKRRLGTWGGFTPNHLLFSSPQTLPLLLRRAGFGAVVMPPWYGETVERGTSRLSPEAQRRLRRAVDRGNRGNMLRAAAFVDPDGPRRWGLEAHRQQL